MTLAQDWAVKDRTYPLEGATVKGSLFDRQACFNLNAFVAVRATENSTTPHLVSALQQLLVSQEIDSSDAETIAASTWEFIDTDTEQQSALGVEDSEYESRTPGYVTPNGMLGDSTEWRAVYGVTKDIMRKVGHFLCALPSDRATLNVNTLTEEDAPILAAMLHPQISVDQAKTLISQRDPVGGWRDIEAFWAEPVFANMEEGKKQALREFIDVRSKFFELDSTVTIDSARLRFRALLKRDDNNGEYTVVRRRFGGVSERNSDDKAEQR
ncbi:type II secretion system minor pseudopilin GspK [Veronia nyctiphanis]|uniref:type II secretion system minor pseudopilin GspK n=1 Tax=Veronia nyctiphanis TaxID=1278244 RepID=UPI001F1E4DAC|nr:type II secretion system minor pseudopilin GspK [Veronia nyctiphanis]